MSSGWKSFMMADILKPGGHTESPLPPPPSPCAGAVVSSSHHESETTRCTRQIAPALPYNDACMEWLLHCWPTRGPLPPPHYGPALASVAHDWPTRLAHTPLDFINTNQSSHNNNMTTNYSNSNLISNTIFANNISNNLLTDFAYSRTDARLSHLHNFNTNKTVNIPSSSIDNNKLTNYNNSVMYEYLTNRSVGVADGEYLDAIKFTTAAAVGVCAGGAGGTGRFPAAASRALERRFMQRRHATRDERRHLAAALALTERQVKTWFQNRRAKWRRSGR